MIAERIVKEWKKKDPCLLDLDGLEKYAEKRYPELLKEEENLVKKKIENLAFSILAPIILDARWPEIPNRLKMDIRLYRIMEFDPEYAHDFEALAYISTTSLCQTLNYTWYRIYFHLFKNYCKRKGISIPQAIAETKSNLDPYELEELRRLKKWIRKKQKEYLKGKA